MDARAMTVEATIKRDGKRREIGSGWDSSDNSRVKEGPGNPMAT